MKKTTPLLIALAIACKRTPPPKPAPPAVNIESQSVATVTTRYVAAGPRLSGTLQAQKSATIVAESAGTVSSVNVQEGQAVAPGTVLARIGDTTAADALRSAQTAVQSATTALAIAQRDQERTTRLANAGALPKRDIDVARSQVANAQAQLASAS